MKRNLFKKALSIILCLAIFSSFAVMVHAEKTVIKNVSATYTIPYAGEKFDFNSIFVPDDANYTAVITGVYYYDSSSSGYVYITADDTIKQGVHYSVRIRFTPDSDYTFDKDTVVEINGTVCKTMVGTNMYETYFYGEERIPEDPTPTFPDIVKKVLSIIFFPITFIIKIFRKIFSMK